MLRNKRIGGPRVTAEKREQAKRQKRLKVTLATLVFSEPRTEEGESIAILKAKKKPFSRKLG
jgi:hypothetical protein